MRPEWPHTPQHPAHHEARHLSPPNPRKKEQPPSSALAAPGEPRREQAAMARGALGKGRVKDGPNTPSGRQQALSSAAQRLGGAEAEDWDLVGDKKRQKGELHSKRVPSSWF